ncbi:hypothetical protein PYCC9005_001752 [Savitreella phatthalungensis]
MDAVVHEYAAVAADRLGQGDDDGLDEILDELDELDDSAYRAQRLQQLNDEVKHLRSLSEGHGTVQTLDEEAVMVLSTKYPRVVVHFAHQDFAKCRVMDKHLEKIAKRYLKVRFVRIAAETAPFLVARLKIQVLPCVIPFVDGQAPGRILGFEGLDLVGEDDFTTASLEGRLSQFNVIQQRL